MKRKGFLKTLTVLMTGAPIAQTLGLPKKDGFYLTPEPSGPIYSDLDVYVGLFTQDGEVNWPGYKRVPIANKKEFSEAITINGHWENKKPIDFAPCKKGSYLITHFKIFHLERVIFGNLLTYPLHIDYPRTLPITPEFAIGDLTVDFD